MDKLPKYIPIDCLFVDRLQDWATRKEVVKIVYRNKAGEVISINTRIIDLYTKNKEEFIVLENKVTFRLDLLVSVNEYKVGSCHID
jgi:Rho-binding antiterminator